MTCNIEQVKYLVILIQDEKRSQISRNIDNQFK